MTDHIARVSTRARNARLSAHWTAGTRLAAVFVATFLVLASCGQVLEEGSSSGGGPLERRDANDGPPSGAGNAGGTVPDAAPDFSVQTFTGERFRLSEHRGTPVVLNFWESW